MGSKGRVGKWRWASRGNEERASRGSDEKLRHIGEMR